MLIYIQLLLINAHLSINNYQHKIRNNKFYMMKQIKQYFMQEGLLKKQKHPNNKKNITRQKSSTDTAHLFYQRHTSQALMTAKLNNTTHKKTTQLCKILLSERKLWRLGVPLLQT